MESNLSCLSSLKDDTYPLYIQPHYKESYRLAIYALLCGGKDAYDEFLKAEQISHFLSDEEILFILQNAALPVPEEDSEARTDHSPSTYFPNESDEEVPDLDLGWPEVTQKTTETNISLLFHPPRQNTPSVKEVVRKQIQEAKKVIAIAMDVFTDVDIFKVIVGAALRGVMVYILLDDSQFQSFLSMSARLGVKIQDLKNLRVRTVKGQQYHCRSGAKFSGALEQKFLLVDCKTVLFGTYSFTWSFEKIHLSMVLVITGQLVASYDEEFRRLFARSTLPADLTGQRASNCLLRRGTPLWSPTCSQLSLHQIHMRSGMMHDLRSNKDGFPLARGLSVQESLHQSHRPEEGNLMRGHSYAGLRTFSRNALAPAAPQRMLSQLLEGQRPLINKTQLQHKHQSRYGVDQHLIPFNSETSLDRWKINSYFNNNEVPVDPPYSVSSPHGSQTALNENQTRLYQGRSRDIQTKLEDIRLKRRSLYDYTNTRPLYSTTDRSTGRSAVRVIDKSQSMAELKENQQLCTSQHPDYHEDSVSSKTRCEPDQKGVDRDKSVPHVVMSQLPVSQDSIKRERKTPQTNDKHKSLPRTLAANLDSKCMEASLKSGSVSTQHSRTEESLLEIPEEKHNQENGKKNGKNLCSAAYKGTEQDKAIPKFSTMISNSSAGRQPQIEARGSQNCINKMPKPGQLGPPDRTTSPQGIVQNVMSVGVQHVVEPESSGDKLQVKNPPLQRKSSLRIKVQSMLRKDEKSLQRRNSMKSQTASGSNHQMQADMPVGQKTQPVVAPVESPPFLNNRLSVQRSSKRQMNGEQDRGSRNTLDGNGEVINQVKKEKTYSQFENIRNTERNPLLISVTRPTGMNSNRDLSTESTQSFSMHQTQTTTDNKFGRFMQRVGTLISKNK